jgi:hypothetical protein
MLTSDHILVIDIHFVSEEMVEMRYQYKEEFVEGSGRTNVVEYSLLFVVVSDIPPFIVFALTPLRPAAGFLLHFEEGIHVIGKESSSFRFRIALFRFIEMPHFVDALNYTRIYHTSMQPPCIYISIRPKRYPSDTLRSSPRVLQIYNSTKDSSNAKSFHQEDCTYPYYQ